MTEPLTEAQKTVLEQQKREYDIKFKTWAIDRVLELLKTRPVDAANDAALVIDQAEKLCAWITSSPKEFAVPSADEAEAMAAHLKHTGAVQ